MQDNSTIAGERPLRSRATTDGLDRAPHRAFPRAMGLAVTCRRLALSPIVEGQLALPPPS